MHTHSTMRGTTIEADENAICGGGPSGVSRRAIEAYFVLTLQPGRIENKVKNTFDASLIHSSPHFLKCTYSFFSRNIF